MKTNKSTTIHRRHCHRHRRGATTVEFAVIAVPFFMLVFGIIEIGRGLMAVQCLEEAARAASRVAILKGATSQEIKAAADEILIPAGIATYAIETEPYNISSAGVWSPISIKISTSLDDIAWLPLPQFLAGKKYTASCTLGKEYGRDD